MTSCTLPELDPLTRERFRSSMFLYVLGFLQTGAEPAAVREQARAFASETADRVVERGGHPAYALSLFVFLVHAIDESIAEQTAAKRSGA